MRLLVAVADHRHHQAVRRVGGEADVPVLLQHQRVAVEAGVELGELLQRGHRRLHHEGQHADLDAALFQLLVHLHAELLEVGDVGLVVRRDMRDDDPVAVQVGGRDLLDARQFLALDRVRTWRSRPSATAAGRGRRHRPPAAAAFAAGAAAAPPPLAKASTSSRTMRPCAPVPLTLPRSTPSLARQLAHRRAGVGERERGFVDAAACLPASPAAAGEGWGGGAAAGAAAATGALPVASAMITLPSLTLSPTLTLIACTTPGSGAGTSIVALSDSSEISGVFGLHRVADLDEDLDHRHVLEVADVGHAHLGHAGRRADRRRRRADARLGRFGRRGSSPRRRPRTA